MWLLSIVVKLRFVLVLSCVALCFLFCRLQLWLIRFHLVLVFWFRRYELYLLWRYLLNLSFSTMDWVNVFRRSSRFDFHIFSCEEGDPFSSVDRYSVSRMSVCKTCKSLLVFFFLVFQDRLSLGVCFFGSACLRFVTVSGLDVSLSSLIFLKMLHLFLFGGEPFKIGFTKSLVLRLSSVSCFSGVSTIYLQSPVLIPIAL